MNCVFSIKGLIVILIVIILLGITLGLIPLYLSLANPKTVAGNKFSLYYS